MSLITPTRNFYAFQLHSFVNCAGLRIGPEDLEEAVQLANPRESGIGISTLLRGILTRSSIYEARLGHETKTLFRNERPSVLGLDDNLHTPSDHATLNARCGLAQ